MKRIFSKELKIKACELVINPLSLELNCAREGGECSMEEQIITITVKTEGEKCEMTDAEIREWYKSHIAKLFNSEYGTPSIEVEVKRTEKRR